MDLKDIRELYAYNRWANQRTLSAAARLDNQAFIRNLGNSFSSVRDTLAHILGAEWIWLERWQGRSPAALLSAADFTSTQSLEARWQAVEGERGRFIEDLTPARLQEEISYTNLRGQRYAYPLWQQMVHVVNHSTYHRGQITTLLRQLGADAVATDFLAYYDEKA
jgi:uncharacterized damage-inducible protein DinB